MSDGPIHALVAAAPGVDVDTRAAVARRLGLQRPPGAVLVETCHRVELYAAGGSDPVIPAGDLPPGAALLDGEQAVDHLVSLAIGLRSTIVGEDQILHQIRTSLDTARARGPLPPELGRLFDDALRSGRRARSWLPPRRRSLADAALDLVHRPLAGERVLVVGTGEIGRLAAIAAIHRGAEVRIGSRTPARAATLAAELGVGATSFDPGDDVARFAVVAVALRGPWPIAARTEDRLAAAGSWIVDLSSPSAVPARLREAATGRLVTIDDIAGQAQPDAEDRTLARLGRLRDETVAAFLAWSARSSTRAAARAMAERAERVRETELGELWRRLPELADSERDEIERMTRHLAERILREPLEQLGRDADGRHERAARELFGL